MKNVELKKESGIIKVRSPYEKAFISEVKMIGGKWDASEKTWDVPEENEEMLRALLLRCYGYAGEDSEMITVEYSPCDFPSMRQDPTTRIGGSRCLKEDRVTAKSPSLTIRSSYRVAFTEAAAR